LEALENASLTNPEIAQHFTILQVNPKITIQWISVTPESAATILLTWELNGARFSSPDCHTSQNCRIVHSRCGTTNRQEMEAKIGKFSSLSATVASYVTTKLPTQFHINRLYDSTRLPTQNTTLTRLRTGTFNLNYYLHKINCADTPKCQCGFNNEAASLPMYRAQRRDLHNNITKIAAKSASPLNLDVLLDQPKCTPSALAFVDAVKLARTAI
jgi:hypothetical protein